MLGGFTLREEAGACWIVGNDVLELFSHVSLVQVMLFSEAVPELEGEILSRQPGGLGVEADLVEDSVDGEETFVVLEVWPKSLLAVDVRSHGDVVLGALHVLLSQDVVMLLRKEVESSRCIGFGYFSVGDTIVDESSELALSVESPHSLEVSLSWDILLHFMGIDDQLLLHELWHEFSESVVIFFESLSSFLGGGVSSEVQLLILISMSERVEGPLWVVQVTSVSVPPWVGNLVVEESGRVASSELLKSEPLEWVWLLSLTEEMLRSVLGLEVSHGVVPGLSGVSIELPSVHLLGGCPVGHLEALEQGSGSSVEADIPDSFVERVGMEVLSIDVVHDVGFLVELLVIEVLDPDSYIILKIK